MSEDLLRSPLHDRHLALEAHLGDLAGWQMPLSYRSALDEVQQCRRRAGIFDVSHVGRIRIRGDGALDLLERLCTHDVARQEDDTAEPTLLCNERGGVIDNGFLLRLSDHWLLTTNPHNRAKVLEHLRSEAQGRDVRIDDQTQRTAQLAVMGPQAATLLDAILPFKPSQTPHLGVQSGSFMIASYTAARVTSSGDWGLEVIVSTMVASLAWDFVVRKAGDNCIAPCGLAAHDVLRLEAGICAYGHELNETIDPITAGLEGLVSIGHDFIGRDAIEKIRQRGPARRRVGLRLTQPLADLKKDPTVDEGIAVVGSTALPRLGMAVLATDGLEIGTITSGTYSPTLEATIAMAYVATDIQEDDEVLLELAGQRQSAKIVPLPFYHHTK